MSDAPAAPSPAKIARTPNPIVKVAAAFLLPLFFIVMFPLMFISAIHKPTPHDLPLLVVGPEQVVAQIATGLDDTEQFSASHTDVEGEGRTSVENRTVDGAIEITVVAPTAEPAPVDPASVHSAPTSADTTTTETPAAAPTFTVTTYVANAAGRAVAATVTAAGAQIAEQLGTTATVIDVAPLAETDTLGTTLFYVLTYTSLAAYLVIIVLMQVMPKAKLSTRFAAVSVASVAAPLIVFGLSSIWVGDYHASFGTIAALLGVNALYVFTVGSAAILIEQFLGKAATFGVMAFIVFLNFPSAGGATPAAMLPPFWQAVHGVYFGSGAYESFRSIVYFGGEGVTRWIFQLLAWTIGLILVNFVVYLAKTVRRQKAEIAALAAASATSSDEHAHHVDDAESGGTDSAHKHLKVESYEFDLPPLPSDSDERRSITAGEGATR